MVDRFNAAETVKNADSYRTATQEYLDKELGSERPIFWVIDRIAIGLVSSPSDNVNHNVAISLESLVHGLLQFFESVDIIEQGTPTQPRNHLPKMNLKQLIIYTSSVGTFCGRILTAQITAFNWV